MLFALTYHDLLKILYISSYKYVLILLNYRMMRRQYVEIHIYWGNYEMYLFKYAI